MIQVRYFKNNKLRNFMKKTILLSTTISMLMMSSSAFAGGSHMPVVTGPDSINESATSEVTNDEQGEQYENVENKWYVALSGVGVNLEDQDYSSAGGNVNAELDDGMGAILAFGHQMEFGFLKGMRGELEAGFRNNDINSLALNGVTTAGATGKSKAYSVMGNVYHDFVNSSLVTPYIGAGIGGARIVAENYNSAAVADSLDDKDTVFAYQGIAGLGFKLSEDWTLQAEYRYFATSEINMSTTSGANADIDYNSNNVVVGLRYAFN